MSKYLQEGEREGGREGVGATEGGREDENDERKGG